MRRAGAFHSIIALATLVVFAMRALVPAGYMLAQDADARGLTVTMCTLQGAVVTHDLSGAADAPEKPAQEEAPCVFALIAPVAPPADGAALEVAVAASHDRAPRSVDVRPGQGLAAPPPWSTGPPALV